jgi:hypothetical protein
MFRRIEPIARAMAELGDGQRTTAAHRVEVQRLAAEGMSLRMIAAEVFGAARYRGRVERILRRARLAPEPTPVGEQQAPGAKGPDLGELGETAVFRLLYERALAAWAASGKAPAMSELRAMLDVQRRLEAFETIERLRPPRQGSEPA